MQFARKIATLRDAVPETEVCAFSSLDCLIAGDSELFTVEDDEVDSFLPIPTKITRKPPLRKEKMKSTRSRSPLLRALVWMCGTIVTVDDDDDDRPSKHSKVAID